MLTSRILCNSAYSHVKYVGHNLITVFPEIELKWMLRDSHLSNVIIYCKLSLKYANPVIKLQQVDLNILLQSVGVLFSYKLSN